VESKKVPKLAANDRIVVEAIKIAVKELDLKCQFFSDGWVVKLSNSYKSHFIHVSSFNLNGQASVGIAQDKVMTYQILTDSSITAVPHYLLSSIYQQRINATYVQELFTKYNSLVLKPTHGSSGHLVTRCNDISSVFDFVDQYITIESWTASPYLEVTSEIRLIVIGNRVECVYEKTEPPIIDELRMYNISLGAHIKKRDVAVIDDEVKKMAVNAAKSLNLTFCAVDIVFESNGKASVLELNTSFSLERYSLESSENWKEAVNFYRQLIHDIFEGKFV
jgi:glutathione synthase/RimK-type ligase-like ATP-grasp enzyme